MGAVHGGSSDHSKIRCTIVGHKEVFSVREGHKGAYFKLEIAPSFVASLCPVGDQ